MNKNHKKVDGTGSCSLCNAEYITKDFYAELDKSRYKSEWNLWRTRRYFISLPTSF